LVEDILFFHLIDISLIINCIILSLEAKAQPDNKDFHRPGHFSFLEVREEVVRQLVDLPEYGNPPVYRVFDNPGHFETIHMPKFSEVKRKSLL